MFVQGLQLKLDIGPDDEQLVQKIQTPFDNLLLLLVDIIVDG